MKATLLCLATEKGLAVLRAAVAFHRDRPLLVCTFREPNVAETFDESIKQTAAAQGVPIASWSELRQQPIDFLRRHDIGSILCIGSRFLVPDAAVRHLHNEVIIAHDSLLPRLRGFAPLPTALICGETETGVTFLRAGQAVDDGDILWQGSAPIAAGDTIRDLIDKVTPLYIKGATRYLRGELKEGRPQDHSRATYSIWRDALDYRIDWQDGADRIERTIRALGRPYLGAQCRLGDRQVVLHRATVAPDLSFAIRQPGKIWNLDREGRPTIVCGRGLLKVLEASSSGASILPLTSLRQRFS